ncbi:MAG: hypothetical protein WBA57_27495 [Elainellaceae cyanobacterium]
MSSNFDEIFQSAESAKRQPSPKKMPDSKPKQSKTEKTSSPPATASPWAEFEEPELEPTTRLNVDIKLSLNDALAEKARKYRIPKTELVRKLLEWALEQAPE